MYMYSVYDIDLVRIDLIQTDDPSPTPNPQKIFNDQLTCLHIY